MATGVLEPCTIELDETRGEANGAAYLVHMLLAQQAAADQSGAFRRQAVQLKPVQLYLEDTGEGCAVVPTAEGLRVTADADGRPATAIRAASHHVIDVTQVRLLGRVLITGPLGEERFWRLLGDIARRRVVIKGLIRHYANTMRFLWLVNVRGT